MKKLIKILLSLVVAYILIKFVAGAVIAVSVPLIVLLAQIFRIIVAVAVLVIIVRIIKPKK